MIPHYRRQRRVALAVFAGVAVTFTVFGIYWSMH